MNEAKDTKREELKILVRGAYDLQKQRIMMGNRIAGNFKARLGQAPGEKESALDEDAQAVLKQLRQDFKRITDGLNNGKLPTLRSFKPYGVIDTYTAFVLSAQYVALLTNEEKQFAALKNVLKDYPLWTEFLDGVKGCGPAMAGVILSEITIQKAQYPSSLWKYAGLDVAGDGQGRTKKEEHRVDRDYIDKDGKPAIRKGITFNPFLKTKLIGVLGPSFLKIGPDRSPYAAIYYDYKRRLENSPAHAEKSKGHRHNMAIRYMVKRFVVDLYIAWRELEGLPIAPEYSESKLGVLHKAA